MTVTAYCPACEATFRSRFGWRVDRWMNRHESSCTSLMSYLIARRELRTMGA